MAVEINDSNFEELSAKGQLMLVDFGAQWCGPCKAVSPIVDELSDKYGSEAVIGKVDIDESPDLCEKFGIRNIPTILFIRDGEVVDKIVGAVAKEKISERLTALI
ncbi:MAG: thioredoxin [Paludibacteraceae bacterium]|nr:thioredoxin [Paludibacteraceae bacterium]MBO5863618.1 thioredoxin [Paludibacteraceae bacterium]MBO5989399.1 thioredoxin [Paludibacteraceae bacterium]